MSEIKTIVAGKHYQRSSGISFVFRKLYLANITSKKKNVFAYEKSDIYIYTVCIFLNDNFSTNYTKFNGLAVLTWENKYVTINKVVK